MRTGYGKRFPDKNLTAIGGKATVLPTTDHGNKVNSRIRELLENVLRRNGLKMKHSSFSWITYLYKTKEDARKIIEHLDGWIVWGCRLSVTESRYKRSGNSPSGRSSDSGVLKGVKENKEISNHTEKQNRHWGQGRSYKDILIQGRENCNGRRNETDGMGLRMLGDSKIYLEGSTQIREQMQQCLVGEMLN
ncbi:hypothetical protein PIB30_017638 [Stylosanthes scabra]|uniref:Uncharacterized protein n=1 Tax=Stylosanthes scabra TaxID=79078 RepID=A0ABU6WBA3_9FABA|nr:hypothetical protein [Stylosanthes scabra]